MYIGIDPGMLGAVAVLAHDGSLQAVYDTPTLTLRTSRGTRQEYDLPGLVALLAPYAGAQAHVTLEESQAMPGQGVRSTFVTGLGFGVWLALLAALALPHARVRPAIWKRALGLSKDKEASRSAPQEGPRQSGSALAGVVWLAWADRSITSCPGARAGNLMAYAEGHPRGDGAMWQARRFSDRAGNIVYFCTSLAFFLK